MKTLVKTSLAFAAGALVTIAAMQLAPSPAISPAPVVALSEAQAAKAIAAPSAKTNFSDLKVPIDFSITLLLNDMNLFGLGCNAGWLTERSNWMKNLFKFA